MHIIVLILSCLCLIFSFIPFFNVISSLVCIFIVVLAIINIVKSKIKLERIKLCIALIISIVSILNSVRVMIPYIPMYLGNSKNLNEEDTYSVFLTYDEYKKDQEIVMKDIMKVKILNVSKSNNECVIDIETKYLSDDYNFSLYDFYLYNTSNNEVYFPKYSSSDKLPIIEKFESNLKRNRSITFSVDNADKLANIYLVYRAYDGFKIKI